MSDTQSWMEGIRASGEAERERIRLANQRLDKIILELDSCDHLWYLQYHEGSRIPKLVLSAYKDDGLAREQRSQAVQNVKRNIVQQSIVPAMHACIRAGYLKPVEQGS